MSTISSSGIFIAMAVICLDRLLKQRTTPGFLFELPPPRDGPRSLSVAALCFVAEDASALHTTIQGPTTS